MGATQHVFIRIHLFPCESISKAGVHYQHNGLPDGCSCYIRLSALGAHSRLASSGEAWGESWVRANQPVVV